MPTITGDSAIDVAIGLGFVFFLLSIVCSSLNEAIAAVVGLRARTLESGIRNLLEDNAQAERFLNSWRIKTLYSNTIVSWFGGHKSKPSYIPARTFALTFLDTFAPAVATGAKIATSDDVIGRAQNAVASMQTATGRSASENQVLGILQDALDQAGTDRDELRAGIETAFNDAMDRVSGWYKRRSQLIMFALAVVLAGAINVDAFTIGQRLWKDDALRATVVAAAVAAGKGACTTAPKVKTSTPTGTTNTTTTSAPLETAANCVSAVKQLGLPIGWTKATSPKHFLQYPTKILGVLLTAFAVMLGAPFWFDFLGKAAQLRSTGAKPKPPPPAVAAS